MNLDKGFFHFAEYVSEQDGKFIVSFPKSFFAIDATNSFGKLKQKDGMFLNCEGIIQKQKQIRFAYQLKEEYRNFNDLSKKTDIEILLLLINVGHYFETNRINQTTVFHPCNVFYTDSYNILFAYRGVVDVMPTCKSRAHELEEYKMLILSSLSHKYTFEKLTEIGMDALDSNPFYRSIIDAQTADEIRILLRRCYQEKYQKTVNSKIAFKKKSVIVVLAVIVALLMSLIVVLFYFIYRNIVVTDRYMTRMHIYESYYQRNSAAVAEYAKKVKDEEMDESLKLIVADALITIRDKESLVRAFYLDPNRQMEVMGHLIELGETEAIANLRSDKLKSKLYQSYYAQDYAMVIKLATEEVELKYDAQAQIILAKAYMDKQQFIQAEEIIANLGDTNLQIEVYESHKKYIMEHETNIALRKEIVDRINQILSASREIEEKIGKEAEETQK